jgi:hypothetical protein
MSASLGYVLERWWFRDALHRQIPICLKPTARNGIEENLPFIPLSTPEYSSRMHGETGNVLIIVGCCKK